jgi:hypothetical protein
MEQRRAGDHLECPENLEALRNGPDTSGIWILSEAWGTLDHLQELWQKR